MSPELYLWTLLFYQLSYSAFILFIHWLFPSTSFSQNSPVAREKRALSHTRRKQDSQTLRQGFVNPCYHATLPEGVGSFSTVRIPLQHCNPHFLHQRKQHIRATTRGKTTWGEYFSEWSPQSKFIIVHGTQYALRRRSIFEWLVHKFTRNKKDNKTTSARAVVEASIAEHNRTTISKLKLNKSKIAFATTFSARKKESYRG